MKPEHFGKVEPTGSCVMCTHRCYIEDLQTNVCSYHAFTLPSPVAHYVCEDYKEPRKQRERRFVTDILGDNNYSDHNILGDNNYRDHKYTLVIPNVWVKCYDLKDVGPGSPPSVSGVLEGYKDGIRYEFSFDATDVLVEDA